MNRRVIAVAAAAVLALVGTLVIVAYVRDADDRARSDVELVEVLVVEEPVEAGSRADEIRAAVGVSLVPAHAVVDNVVTDLDQLEGRVAAVDLVPGEQVLAPRFIDEIEFDIRPTLTSVPAGKHEVTVSLDPERAIGGQVAPGDTVAVIGSFTPFDIAGRANPDAFPTGVPTGDPTGDPTAAEGVAADDSGPGQSVLDLPVLVDGVLTEPGSKSPNTTHIFLHKVLVTRVQVEELPQERVDNDGNQIDTGDLAPTGNLLVTLALDAPDVERLVFTAEFGLIWLSYEPADASEEDTSVITRAEVYGLGSEEFGSETIVEESS